MLSGLSEVELHTKARAAEIKRSHVGFTGTSTRCSKRWGCEGEERKGLGLSAKRMPNIHENRFYKEIFVLVMTTKIFYKERGCKSFWDSHGSQWGSIFLTVFQTTRNIHMTLGGRRKLLFTLNINQTNTKTRQLTPSPKSNRIKQIQASETLL